MLFHTTEFALLFVGTLFFAYSRDSTFRKSVLLGASYLFYAWFSARLLLVLIGVSCFDYFLAKQIVCQRDPTLKKLLLVASVGTNLSILFFFKYIAWALGLGADLLGGNAPQWMTYSYHIPLPLGVSFYTFQSITYTVDVYRGKMTPAKNLLSYALYVAFFPHLVAGPIVKASYLLRQLQDGPKVSLLQIRSGIFLVCSGLFKKIAIADNLAPIVEQVYARPAGQSQIDVVVATIAFAFQIYGDFAGYTDMARGFARILGYDLGTNFNSPYFAAGIRDFWRRWHISLSTWLRDYLYISLGGNRSGVLTTCRNIMLTMVLGGLWHGANMTYMLWGLIHGVYIVCAHLISPPKFWARTPPWLRSSISIPSTFLLVCFTWIFFRATSVNDALILLKQLGHPGTITQPVAYVVGLSCVTLTLDYVHSHFKLEYDSVILKHSFPFWTLCWGYVLATLLFGNFSGGDFVYFQF